MVLIGFIVALAGLMVIAPLIWRYPVAVAITGIVAAVFCDITDIGVSGIQLGITVYPADLSCVALIAACISLALRNRSFPRDLCWPAVILLGLVILNFIRGVVLFGVRAPGNDARDLFNLVLPVVALSSMGWALKMDVNRLVRYLR